MQKHNSKIINYVREKKRHKKTTDKQTRPFLICRTIKCDLLNTAEGFKPTAGVTWDFVTNDRTMMPLSPPSDYMAVLHLSDQLNKTGEKNTKNNNTAAYARMWSS